MSIIKTITEVMSKKAASVSVANNLILEADIEKPVMPYYNRKEKRKIMKMVKKKNGRMKKFE